MNENILRFGEGSKKYLLFAKQVFALRKEKIK